MKRETIIFLCDKRKKKLKKSFAIFFYRRRAILRSQLPSGSCKLCIPELNRMRKKKEKSPSLTLRWCEKLNLHFVQISQNWLLLRCASMSRSERTNSIKNLFAYFIVQLFTFTLTLHTTLATTE